MKKKPGSLIYQIIQLLKKQQRFGQSRHSAKAEYKALCKAAGVKCNSAAAPGIFSYNTYTSYWQTAVEFASWLKLKYKVRHVVSITRDMAKEYLTERDNQGLSAWTVSKDLSAINKMFNFGLTKKEMNLKKRCNKNITRSRGAKAHDKRYNPANYEGQIMLAKACGCRRVSVTKTIPEHFKRDVNGLVVSVWLKEKGGLPRYATILAVYRAQLTAIVDSCQPLVPLFQKYPTAIDNHAFRAEYARARYAELAQETVDLKADYRGYDSNIIAQVSLDLGHRRLPVVVENYMR